MAALPVLILQYDGVNGPVRFARFLAARAQPYVHLRLDQSAAPAALVPAQAHAYAGICLMGGPMSANDNLPWISPVLNLIRNAVAQNIPVIGHCLGAQLLAKALGASISDSPTAEIGWGHAQVDAHDIARNWYGHFDTFPVYHWHYETFAIPPGATRVLSNAYCPNQAFVMGPHFASQAHIEIDEQVVHWWANDERARLAELSGPAIQSHAAMLADTPTRLPAMQAMSEHIYTRWLAGLHTSATPPALSTNTQES